MGIHSRVSVEIPDDGREEEEERERCSCKSDVCPLG